MGSGTPPINQKGIFMTQTQDAIHHAFVAVAALNDQLIANMRGAGADAANDLSVRFDAAKAKTQDIAHATSKLITKDSVIVLDALASALAKMTKAVEHEREKAKDAAAKHTENAR